ncbi:hypothetical protein FRX31_007583 [Thalictrum thalictroides]|uniref:Uncharacterized protein n=1 Tax=Thalictrum thalictroides TaxID=46969 RepID=A0A7J6X2C7_THATH|nr:hypothetical protein FRX31_007583 [Thalictrum thalictroides]
MVTSESVSWEPPPPGWIKINFDASFDVYSKSRVAAAVARDHEGIILAGGSKKINVQDVLEAESLASCFEFQSSGCYFRR